MILGNGHIPNNCSFSDSAEIQRYHEGVKSFGGVY